MIEIPDHPNLDQLYRRGILELADLDHFQQLSGKRIAIVGSTGLIGSALLDVLLQINTSTLSQAPMSIIAIGRQANPASDGYTYVQASVTEVALESLPDVDVVIYVAGTTSDYRQQYENTLDTQIIGLNRFLKRFHSCERFVYISSARVYGLTDNKPVTEDQPAQLFPMHLDNLYNSAKHLGESMCLLYFQNESTNTIVLRPTNVYGLTMRGSNAKISIRDFVKQSLEANQIELRGHPDSVRNLCCVLDVVQGILRAILRGRGGQAYNIGSDDHLTIGQLAHTIAAQFDPPRAVHFLGSDNNPSFQNVSIDKASSELGFVPHYKFNDVAPIVVQQTIRAIQQWDHQ